jgi:hypothetical protein
MAFGLAGFCAHADTIKLKDGTVLEGDITAEDEAMLSVYLEFSGGTITQTRLIKKADVAEVVRWTPAQRAQWQAKRDYENLERYRLTPDGSYKVGYYDQIINDVFRKFLARHPDSPHTSSVTERIIEWRVERDIVAAGKAKFHGQWLPAAEAARLIERERGQQLLQQGRSLISQGQLESAIQQLQPILSMSTQTDLVSQAEPLLASAYQQVMAGLDRQRQQLESDVSSTQQRVDRAKQAVNDAEASLKQAMNSGSSLGGSIRDAQSAPAYQAMGSSSQPIAMAQTAVANARSDLNSAQNHLELIQSQLAVVMQKVAALQSRPLATHASASTSGPQAPESRATAPAPTSITADSPDILVGIIAWLKKYWPVMAAAGVVIVFVLSRYTKG